MNVNGLIKIGKNGLRESLLFVNRAKKMLK